MQISQPVNDFAATATAKIHEKNHDARRTITRQKSKQHHQMCLGQFFLPQNVSFLGFVPFTVAMMQVAQLFDLLFHGQEHAHVGETQNKNRAKQCQVGEHESVRDEADGEQQTTAGKRRHPDGDGSLEHACIAHVNMVPHR